MKKIIFIALLIASAGIALAYTEESSGEYRYTIKDVAEAFGYSALSLPQDSLYLCRIVDGQAQCLAVPTGSMLLVPADTTGEDAK